MTVLLRVDAVNDPPEAQGGSAAGDEDAAVEVDLRTLVRDVETPAGALTSSVGGGVNGTAELLADGHTARFTPSPDYNGGGALFTYSVSDGGGGGGGGGGAPPATAGPVTIGVNVRPVNDRPTVTADADAVTVDEGQTATMAGRFGDVDSTPVTLRAWTGTVTPGPGGTWN